eukprot:CAMPEP_0177609340 /NCGR_PEP_ID=MMETSP0419_2-20121207/19025_1 /TAXON_ID=582737 /ORGANISM="Tetraselmis sp., Strain GSL018" /LENGTH=226 /DNA_ID=CAMNT_0019104235 /DNA_START=59 /DNA_END=735 /DNA_ORIENTATION=+
MTSNPASALGPPAPSLPSGTKPASISTEQIQKYLEENKTLITIILEHQNQGKLQECAQYQQRLQQNLMYLAALADAQQLPQNSALPAQQHTQAERQQTAAAVQHVLPRERRAGVCMAPAGCGRSGHSAASSAPPSAAPLQPAQVPPSQANAEAPSATAPAAACPQSTAGAPDPPVSDPQPAGSAAGAAAAPAPAPSIGRTPPGTPPQPCAPGTAPLQASRSPGGQP